MPVASSMRAPQLGVTLKRWSALHPRLALQQCDVLLDCTEGSPNVLRPCVRVNDLCRDAKTVDLASMMVSVRRCRMSACAGAAPAGVKRASVFRTDIKGCWQDILSTRTGAPRIRPTGMPDRARGPAQGTPRRQLAARRRAPWPAAAADFDKSDRNRSDATGLGRDDPDESRLELELDEEQHAGPPSSISAFPHLESAVIDPGALLIFSPAVMRALKGAL